MSDNNTSYINALLAEIAAAKAEIEALQAEANAAKAETKYVKAEAEAVKAEAEAMMAEAVALKAEAEALMAEAEAYKRDAEVGAKVTKVGSPAGDGLLVNSNVSDSGLATKPTPQMMAPVVDTTGGVSIAAMEENEKLPKERVLLYPDEYQMHGVTNFKATVFKDYDYDGYSML